MQNQTSNKLRTGSKFPTHIKYEENPNQIPIIIINAEVDEKNKRVSKNL